MATAAINTWFADAFGVDPATFEVPPAPAASAGEEPNQSVETDEAWLNESIDTSAPNRSVEPAPEPGQSVETDEAWFAQSVDTGGEPSKAEAEKEAVKEHAFKAAGTFSETFELFESKDVAVFGGMFEGKAKVSLDISGAAQTIAAEAHETKKVGLKVSRKSLAAELGKSWYDANGVKVLGLNTMLVECEFTGVFKTGAKGFQVGLVLAGKLACGVVLEIEANVLKIEHDWALEAGEIACAVKTPSFQFFPDVDLVPNLQLSDVFVIAAVAIEFKPNWKRIAAEVAKKFGEDAALEAAAKETATRVAAQETGETAAAAAEIDLAIASGFLLIAAASIAASIGAIGVIGDAAKTPGEVRALTAELLEGYRMGVMGYGVPTGPVMGTGYDEGAKAHDVAVAKLQARNPGITPDEVQEVLYAVADRLVEQARPDVERMAKEQVWANFFGTHEDSLITGSQEERRRVAFGGIFGHAPSDTDPLFLTGRP